MSVESNQFEKHESSTTLALPRFPPVRPHRLPPSGSWLVHQPVSAWYCDCPIHWRRCGVPYTVSSTHRCVRNTHHTGPSLHSTRSLHLCVELWPLDADQPEHQRRRVDDVEPHRRVRHELVAQFDDDELALADVGAP